ncbi:hypothetical protein HAX54_045771 [Datura stramonium]|uniref:Uncharacterized protein n=1 Tax=Datura stramonium TaxID=4076 RepID=A0ABS8WG49_DATST|nr:hypothetical protein [Datura stramonium]
MQETSHKVHNRAVGIKIRLESCTRPTPHGVARRASQAPYKEMRRINSMAAHMPHRRIWRFAELDLRAAESLLRTAYATAENMKNELLRPERGSMSRTMHLRNAGAAQVTHITIEGKIIQKGTSVLEKLRRAFLDCCA